MKKHLAVMALLAAVTAGCGGGGSSDSADLADCVAQEGQALMCGTVKAADGTPIVGAEVMNTTSGTPEPMNGYYKAIGGSSAKMVEKGMADTCLTDANGGFACGGITTSGAYTFSVTETGFAMNFSSSLTLDEITNVPEADTTASGSDITAKWLVIMGSWDGVQLLLSQLKDCTLTGDPANPAAMTASAECTAANLVVKAASEISTIFSSLSNISGYNSIFINCGTDVSAYSTVIQQYVEAGGNIYFSDLADPGLTAAFPDKVTFGTGSTDIGDVTGNLDNADLAEYIGDSTFTITFDLGGWMPVESVASGVTTYVSGDTSELGGTANAPITVGWKEGSGGCVYYTSYHIEGASTGSNQEKVLKYLILNVNAMCE